MSKPRIGIVGKDDMATGAAFAKGPVHLERNPNEAISRCNRRLDFVTDESGLQQSIGYDIGPLRFCKDCLRS